nr:unnamed protein product [Callosobruchus chinensis]
MHSSAQRSERKNLRVFMVLVHHTYYFNHAHAYLQGNHHLLT